MTRMFACCKPLVLVVCLLATACIPAPRTADLSPPTFAGKQKILFEVAEVRVRHDYSPRGGNTIEHQFPTTPAQGVEIWARERLQAVGHEGLLEVVIEDASVTEAQLPLKTGIEGALTKEPSKRYSGVLEVELRLYTPERASAKGHVDARVTVSRELLEKAAETERKELFAAMTRDMLSKLDAQLDHSIHEYLSNHLASR